VNGFTLGHPGQAHRVDENAAASSKKSGRVDGRIERPRAQSMDFTQAISAAHDIRVQAQFIVLSFGKVA
jgi:hypothetical protein